ncbi:cation diffusion facilitator family transporter [Labedella phragmitis]|uniref:Cation diffusion facilitator family transporter n=1 Tax=Labedella phragmitis TaxID=2498849 RepID=A0A3S3YVM0_9MICO|nr:cation diffusion facilitator family transporter [Labedella phragmitis]
MLRVRPVSVDPLTGHAPVRTVAMEDAEPETGVVQLRGGGGVEAGRLRGLDRREVAAWQAIDRIINPQPISYLGWVIAGGVIGFLGNEAVAIFRIRVGRKIGSAALVADGVHARTDGFTSLAVVIGGIGVLLGFPLADPIVGLLISAMIVVLLIGTVRSVGRRRMDGIETELLATAEHALEHEVTGIDQVRLRWIGHRLHGEAVIRVHDVSRAEANRIAAAAEDSVKRHLPSVDDMAIRTLAK